VNCWLVPFAIKTLPGLIAIDKRAGAVTATLVEFVTVPELALILAVPIVDPITSPLPITVATVGESDAQIAEAVKSSVLPSL
jgi:hypothetical protein